MARKRSAFETLLGVKVVLLVLGAVLALRFGPFKDGDGWEAILTGMVLVAAMAIQNAVHRIHLASSPPGTTTQIMIDVADMIHPLDPGEKAAGPRLAGMTTNILFSQPAAGPLLFSI